jgi:hypothetical protein
MVMVTIPSRFHHFLNELSALFRLRVAVWIIAADVLELD